MNTSKSNTSNDPSGIGSNNSATTTANSASTQTGTPMNTFVWLLKREFWEHRGGFLRAPADHRHGLPGADRRWR